MDQQVKTLATHWCKRNDWDLVPRTHRSEDRETQIMNEKWKINIV